MRAVVITEDGPPEVLQVAGAPGPAAGPGQVAIDVRAAGVNFADTMARVGLYPDAPKLPAVVGYEVGGHACVGHRASACWPARASAATRRAWWSGEDDVVPLPGAAVVRAGRGDPGQLLDRLGRARPLRRRCRPASAC